MRVVYLRIVVVLLLFMIHPSLHVSDEHQDDRNANSSLASRSQSHPGKNEVLKVGVNEVLLDVVVTDKRGRQIRKIDPADFQVFEDGIAQKISSFREISTLTAMEEAAPAAEAIKEAVPQPAPAVAPVQQSPANYVTLVFDQLSTHGRLMARQAAREYIQELGTTDYVSVMAIDMTLRVIAPFTRDPARLQAAVELATGGTPQQFAEATDAVREAMDKASQSAATADASAAQASSSQSSAGSGSIGAAAADAKANEMIGNMIRVATISDETIQGRATMESLLKIVRAEQSIPGRKAVIYFAEQLHLPTQVIMRFRDLTSAANRANVSFYCVDTTGLNPESQLGAMGRELYYLGGVSERQQHKKSSVVTREEAMFFDHTENVQHASAQGNLLGLAEHTGGVFISNTNDLRPGLRSVSEDLHIRYELSYVPTNTSFDGKFREIEVKVNRTGAAARTRDGYFAIPTGVQAESPFELPLLAALQTKPVPQEVPVRNATMLFPSRNGRSLALVYAEIPLLGFQFQTLSDHKQYQAGISIMAILKNSDGQPIEKISQEIPLQGLAAQIQDTQARNFVFYRVMDVGPGRYTLELVVRDSLSQKVTVKRSLVMVPASTPAAPALSSVVMVKRLDSVKPTAHLLESPLTMGEQAVVPYLNPVINHGEWPELGFYFIITPLVQGSENAPESPLVDLVISCEGKLIGHLGDKPLPAPDEQGQVRYMARLPIANFNKGSYDVTIVIRQGKAMASGMTAFQVQ